MTKPDPLQQLQDAALTVATALDELAKCDRIESEARADMDQIFAVGVLKPEEQSRFTTSSFRLQLIPAQRKKLQAALAECPSTLPLLMDAVRKQFDARVGERRAENRSFALPWTERRPPPPQPVLIWNPSLPASVPEPTLCEPSRGGKPLPVGGPRKHSELPATSKVESKSLTQMKADIARSSIKRFWRVWGYEIHPPATIFPPCSEVIPVGPAARPGEITDHCPNQAHHCPPSAAGYRVGRVKYRRS